MKKAYIEFTEEQKQKLHPIADALMQSNDAGAPGMVLAQVLFTGRDVVAVVGFIPSDKAEKLHRALKPKKPVTFMTDKMARRRLEKARANGGDGL